MSLQTNKSAIEGSLQPALAPPVRKSAVAPVFQPEFERSLRLHPRAAAVAACVALLLILLFAFRHKPLYEAESLVKIEPTETRLINDTTGGLFDSGRYDSYLQQQMLTAARPDILAAAVAGLPLATRRQWGATDTLATAHLASLLKTQRVGNSYQLSFTLRGEDPEATAATLNAIVATYLEAGRRDALSLSGGRAQILLEEKGRLQQELATARAEQARLSASLGMANPGVEGGNPYDSQLSGLRAELAGAREAHDIAAAQLASVSGAGLAPAQGLTAAAEDSIAGDAGLSSMKATISQRRAVLAGQMAGLTPENPIYRHDQEEIADLDRSLSTATNEIRDKAARRLQDKLRTDLARTGDVEARLNAQLGQQTFAATSAAPKLQRASELTLDIQRLMARYASVDDAMRTLKLDDSSPGAVHLALAASAPLNPIPNRRSLLLLLALPLALAVGLAAAVVARKRNPRVYLGRDVEEVLGFSPIAVLPAADEVSESVLGEHILRLAGGIESAFRTANARVFVFTSAGGALDLAELTIALAARLEQLGLDQITVQASTMLDAGFTPQMRMNPVTGRGEGVIAANLAALKAEHTLVFVVAPPLLTSAETECVVRSSDATILVARSGVLGRAELLASAHLLERLRVRGVAVVLEGLSLRNADPGFREAVAALDRRHRDAVPDSRPARISSQRPKAPAAYEVPRFASVPAAKTRNPVADPAVADRRISAARPIAVAGFEREPKHASATRAVFASAPAAVTLPEAQPDAPAPTSMPLFASAPPAAPEAAGPATAVPESRAVVPEAVVPEAVAVEPAPSSGPELRAEPAALQPAPAMGWLRRLLPRSAAAEESHVVTPRLEDDPIHRSRKVPPPAVPAERRASIRVASPIAASGVTLPASPALSPDEAKPAAIEPVAPVAVASPSPSAERVEQAPAEELPAAEPMSTDPAAQPASEARPGSPVTSPEDLEALADPILPPPTPVYEAETPLPAVPAAPVQPDLAAAAEQPAAQAVAMTSMLHREAAVPDFWEQAISEPAIVESDPSASGRAEPPALNESISGLLETSSPLAPAATPSAHEDPPSLRTGRWEPIQPLRPDVAPWRDRRIAGASAVRPFGPERRFNWAQNAAQTLGSLPANPAPRSPVPPPAGLELVPREPRLSRSWALLSRFSAANGAPSDAPPEPSPAPESPRASGEDDFEAPVRASRRS